MKCIELNKIEQFEELKRGDQILMDSFYAMEQSIQALTEHDKNMTDLFNQVNEKNIKLTANQDKLIDMIKDFADLLVNPYDYSDRESDEIKERAEEYLKNV